MSDIIHGPKIPLAQATTEISMLLELIEDSDALTPVTPPEFALALEGFRSSVDRRICHFEILSERKSLLQKLKAQVNTKIKAVEAAVEMLEKQTTGVIQAHPELDFEGFVGRISLKRVGGVRAIEWSPSVIFERKYWTVFPAVLEMDPLLRTYVRSEQVDVFDKEKFDKDVRSGAISPMEMVCNLKPQGTRLDIK